MNGGERLSSRHWLGKTLAGIVLGFVLALLVSGVLAWLTPGAPDAGEGKIQFNMWVVAPLWCVVLSGVYLFRDSLRAWAWLGAANLLALFLLGWLRTRGG